MKVLLICLSLFIITGCSMVNFGDKTPKKYKGLCKSGYSRDKKDIDLRESMIQYITKDGTASYFFSSENQNSKEYLLPLYTLPNKYHVVVYRDYIAWKECNTSTMSGWDNTTNNYYIDSSVFSLTIVDVETLETIRTIDVLEIIKENYKDYQIDTDQGNSKVLVRDGKYYHPVPLFKRPTELVKGKKMDVAVLLINIETGEFKLSETPYEDYILNSISFRTIQPYSILWGTTDDPKIYLGAANGVPLDVRYPLVWQGTEFENVITIKINAEKLPENNNRLYTLFPELKEVRDEYINIEEGKTMYFQLDRREFPTWQDVLKLFMEDGQEISFDKWGYESEEDYYRIMYWDYETELTKFKDAMKAQGFEEPTNK